ncbi:MAG: OmpA family protein [Bdellovibrionales bacterium]|nr:OmpA family protein [Bdellovibrionales bacterium]
MRARDFFLGFLLAFLLAADPSQASPLNRTSLLLGVGAGYLGVSTTRPSEGQKTGNEGNLRLIVSPEWDHWLLDLGGGYQYGMLTSDSGFPLNKIKVITRSFVGEVSPRMKLTLFGIDGFQLGPAVQVLTGGDASYDENGTVEELSTQYRAGAKFLYQWGEDFRWRIGASVLSSLNIENRNALSALLDLQFGFTPVRPAPEPRKITGAGTPDFAEVKDRSIRIYLGEALLSFPIGSEKINSKAKEALASLVPVLLRNEKTWSSIRVEGHTDSRNKNNQNQVLSERRAQSVANELLRLGLPADRVAALGFGATKPIDTGDTEAAYLLNRRVEIWIDDIDSTQTEPIMTELRQMK